MSPARGEFLAHLRDGERLVVRDLETGGGAACYAPPIPYLGARHGGENGAFAFASPIS